MRLDGTTAASAALGLRTAAPTASRDLATAQRALAAAKDGEADAEEVGRRFEELFATMLVRELRKGAEALSDEGGLFGGSAGADVYSGWFDEHVGRTLAERDTLDLVGLVKAGVTRLQASEAAAAEGRA